VNLWTARPAIVSAIEMVPGIGGWLMVLIALLKKQKNPAFAGVLSV